MSSAVVSTSAALGRLFVFVEEVDPEVRSFTDSPEPVMPELPLIRFQSTIKTQKSTISPGNRNPAIGIPVIPASRLEIRPALEMATSGITALDALTGGLPRGCLTEICGPASSGRTTLLLAALAAATRRGEFCAVVDASDALDPQSTAAAGVDLERLLWVRCGENLPQKAFSPRRHPSTSLRACPEPAEGMGISPQPKFNFEQSKFRASEHRLEQVLRATDLLLESGGFGLIALDLGDVPLGAARRIPLTTWFRFRRAVEHKPTILLAIEQQPIAGSCSSLRLQLGAAKRRKNAAHGVSRGISGGDNEAPGERKKPCAMSDFRYPAHADLLTGLNINAELICSRLERKPARSVTFATKTAWAG